MQKHVCLALWAAKTREFSISDCCNIQKHIRSALLPAETCINTYAPAAAPAATTPTAPAAALAAPAAALARC